MTWICWLLAAVCCLSVLYGNFDTTRGVHIPSKAETALYTSTHTTVWALGVGWVIYSCATGTDIRTYSNHSFAVLDHKKRS